MASLAGCVLVQDTFERSASPAGVGTATLDETGFEHRETNEMSFNQTVDALGQSRELKLTNWLVTYGKSVEEFGPDAAKFRLFSTPSITVVGNEINPFDSFDDQRLLGEAGAADDSTGDLDQEDTRTVETLGDDVTYTRYRTERQVGGESVSAFLYVGRFSRGDDLLAAIGSHPEALDESENIYELAAAVEHPFE